MARFYGKVGFAVTVELPLGRTEDVIEEFEYFGDVLRNTRSLGNGELANNDISVGNSISILADPYAMAHIFAMRYVEWQGSLWTVSDVEVRERRLILRIGEVYNGPRPKAEAP